MNRLKSILYWVLILGLIISVCVRRDNISKCGVWLALVRFIGCLDLKRENQEPNQARSV